MKRTILFIMTVILCAFNSYAQVKFEGIVMDDNDNPIPNAIAIRFDKKGIILESSISNNNGYFRFHNIDFQQEAIRVTAFGYKAEEIKNASSNEINNIILHSLAVNLDEIVVSAKLHVIQKSDRLVFNSLPLSLTKGNNTYELLKITPLVQENNSKISMLGKESILLYINGKKTNLTQEALQSYLQSLPAENIESIEVITNPGVTYTLSGNQGIINLMLKKNELEGLKGSFKFEDQQSLKKNSQNGGLYIDFLKQKFALSSSIYSNHQRFLLENTTQYYFHNDNKWDSAKNKINGEDLYAGANLRIDYNLSKNHTIGTLIDLFHVNRKSNTNNATQFYNTFNELTTDSTYQSYNKSSGPINRLSLNINYRAKLSDAGNTLSLDIDYLNNGKSQNVFNTFTRIQTEGIPEYTSEFDQISKDKFNNYSGKAEYKQIINNKHNLTVGAEFYITSSNSAFHYTTFENDKSTLDPTKSNNFEYQETLLSGYLSYNWGINEKIMGSVGIKIENANSRGWQKVTEERTKRQDLDVLPNLSILYQPNANNRISYNFSSIAARPGYYSLNPFKFFINPNTYKEYNPNLQTAKAYFQNLTYIMNRNYIFSVGYSYISNVTNNFLVPIDDKYIKLLNANYGNLHMVSPNFSWISSLLNNHLSSRITVGGDYRREKGQVETIQIDNKAFSYYITLYSNILLSKKTNWNVTLNARYYSKSKLAHENSNASYGLSLGVRKVFPKDISLTFGINNLLTNYHDIRTKSTEEYQYYIKNHYYTQTAYISLTIPFGNQKTRGAQNRYPSSSTTNHRLKE